MGLLGKVPLPKTKNKKEENNMKLLIIMVCILLCGLIDGDAIPLNISTATGIVIFVVTCFVYLKYDLEQQRKRRG